MENQPMLLACEHVPTGFEVVIQNRDVEMGKAWNLWWNVTLSDDPARWDAAVEHLNAMQRELGPLGMEQRLVRAQIAEFCRYHPSLAEGLDRVCWNIGVNRFQERAKLGCEGRGLLDGLGYHDAEDLRLQRRDLLSGYVRAIRAWATGSQPQGLLAGRVSGFLGRPTAEKMRFVEWLLPALEAGEPSPSALRALVEAACRASHGRSVREIPGRPFNCFDCDACSTSGGPASCPCCIAMLIDAGLLCAGTREEERPMAGEFSRSVQETVLAYALALNAWLSELPPLPVTAFVEARFVPKALAEELAAQVRAALGEPTPTKVWLAGCLLKTVQDNQRWHQRLELIDVVPEAAAWFAGA